MSEASIRTIAWREQKRQEGYQPVSIWIPASVKNAMANLAFQRHQDLGELLVEAFQAWSPARGGKPVSFTDPHRIEALIDRKIAEALAAGSPSPQEAPAPAEAAPAPAGMKQCKKGHAPYPQAKTECPQCMRERTQAFRRRQAEQRRGVVPA
jgi:hypothetical protein